MLTAEVISEVKSRGVELFPVGDRLRFRPASALTTELVDELREHKDEILETLTDDNQAPLETVAEVFDLAHARFRQSRRLDPSEHPPSKREMWVNPDKEAFFFPERRGGEA
jgi:hypothetical protein